jgi:hypothetical protein
MQLTDMHMYILAQIQYRVTGRPRASYIFCLGRLVTLTHQVQGHIVIASQALVQAVRARDKQQDPGAGGAAGARHRGEQGLHRLHRLQQGAQQPAARHHCCKVAKVIAR